MRFAFVLSLVLVGGNSAAAADILAEMQGEWRGGETSLSLDFERDQARLDPARPFNWERLSVKSVEGSEVTFSVGTLIYTATIVDGALALRSLGDTQPELLQRPPAEEPASTSSIGRLAEPVAVPITEGDLVATSPDAGADRRTTGAAPPRAGWNGRIDER